MDPREADGRIASEVLPEAVDRPALPGEVELPADGAGRLRHEIGRPVELRVVEVALREARDLREDREVTLDDGGNPGPADLDRHFLAPDEGRAMDLGDRGRGQRAGSNRRKT